MYSAIRPISGAILEGTGSRDEKHGWGLAWVHDTLERSTMLNVGAAHGQWCVSARYQPFECCPSRGFYLMRWAERCDIRFV